MGRSARSSATKRTVESNKREKAARKAQKKKTPGAVPVEPKGDVPPSVPAG